MTTPKKTAAKSGDRRQPRLQDIERLESKVEQLTGKFQAYDDLLAAKGSSPFDGMTFDQVCAGFAYAIAVLQPGAQTLDYLVGQRIKRSMRALKAVMADDESMYEDRPKRRSRPTPGAVETPVEGVKAEAESVSSSEKVTTAEALGLTPPTR